MAQFDDAEALEALREPGAGLVMRALDASDFDKGFVALLGQVFPPLRPGLLRGGARLLPLRRFDSPCVQLTKAPALARDRWMEIFEKMRDR
jgi:hypothetical protein